MSATPNLVRAMTMADEPEEGLDAIKAYNKVVSPATVQVAKKRPKSTPVRNPAFREHEGLKALQKQLNTRGKK